MRAPSALERFRAAKKAYFALVRAELTIPEIPRAKRWSQVMIRFHLGTWYLLPFTTNPDVPGLYHVTWLFFTIRITWKSEALTHTVSERQ